MFGTIALVTFTLLASARAQQVGTQTAETHPPLTWQTCTTAGGCTTVSGSVTLDSNWRWLHSTTGYTNCYTGNTWDATLCPDPVTCAENCALDGAAYASTYGITTSGNALTLAFKTGTNVGSRVYLLASDTEYQMFDLLNKEFTFDVDVSKLGCGLNGALYFSEMDADGGMARFPNNKAGAKYGTGYCDSQCPRDLKFINGEANILGWNGTSANSGKGEYGTCCNEMDVWEANSIAEAYTPHPCTVTGQTRCNGTDCTSGFCDPAGCDFNSYRLGNTTFYGPGETINTNNKITVVTQFLTADGTSTGTLSEIRRLYVINGQVIQNSAVNIPGIPAGNSITDAFCAAQKTAFNDTNTFAAKGGLTAQGQAFGRGVVLVMSIWDDYAANMLWLDSQYPTNVPATNPGVTRGTCATTSGVPADVESQQASASVTYSNIKFGDIGSTYPSGGMYR
ncbi:glycoside hydrolase family 7 protein [Jaapia argillacea MUCL 33604]|uniref:Glucanase n=1 Tax=Jaapia argillacea MUCL 33604 TaxID=933084 RepID=A0A067QE78_9AGAM|nr:glycoside hydrolase family 7 protein [Jaapia argillacea MUCL 33604]